METDTSETNILKTELEISNCCTADVTILTSSTPAEQDTSMNANFSNYYSVDSIPFKLRLQSTKHTVEHKFFDDDSPPISSRSIPKTARTACHKEDKYKEFSCTYCGKHFNHKGNMQQHMRTHTQERPFNCTVCGMCYKKSSHLLEHRRRHKGSREIVPGSRENRHKCAICNRTFQSKSSLVKHSRAHSNECTLNCDKCDMKFRHSSTLYRHLKVHTGNKNYTCDICQRKFYDSSDLKKHIVIHTGSEQNECYVCKKRFVRSSDLKKHITVHSSFVPREFNVCKKLFVKPGHLCRSMKKKSSVVEMRVMNKSDQMDSFDTEMLQNVTERINKPIDVLRLNDMLNKVENVNVNHSKCDIVKSISGQHLEKFEKTDISEKVNPEDRNEKVNTDEDDVAVLSRNQDRNTVIPNTQGNEVTLKQPQKIVASERHENVISLVDGRCRNTEDNTTVKTENKSLSTMSPVLHEVETLHTGRSSVNNTYMTAKHSTPLYVSDKARVNYIDQVRAKNITHLLSSNLFPDIESKTVLESVSESRRVKYSTTVHSEVKEEVSKCGYLYDDATQPKGLSIISKTYNDTICGRNKREQTCQMEKTANNQTFHMKQDQDEEVLKNLVQKLVDKNQVIRPKITVASQLEHNTITTKQDKKYDDVVLKIPLQRSIEINQVVKRKSAITPQTKHHRVNTKPDKKHYEAVLKILEKNKAIQPKSTIRAFVLENPDNVKEGNYLTSNRLNCGQIDTSNYRSNNKNAESKTETVTKSENLRNKESYIYLNEKEQVKVTECGSLGSEDKTERYIEMATTNCSETLTANDTCVSREQVKADKKQEKVACRTCRHCQRNFYDREQYLQHLRGHMKVAEFTCADCGLIFEKWRNFSKHTCTKGDPNEKSVKKYEYVCAHCDRVFKYEGHMDCHMNRSKACHICKKVFCTIKKMEEHMETHRKFYDCDQCRMRYYLADTLQIHKKRYHSVHPYKCNLCKRSFLWESLLKRHSQTHHNTGSYKCEKCKRRFILPYSLSRHKAICCRDTAVQRLEEENIESLNNEYDQNEELKDRSSHIGYYTSTVDKDELNAVESFAKKTGADAAACVLRSSACIPLNSSSNSIEQYVTGTDKRSVYMLNSKTKSLWYKDKLRNNTNKRKKRQQIGKLPAYSRNKLWHVKRILKTTFRSYRNNTESSKNNVKETIAGKGTDDLNEQCLEVSNDEGDETIRNINRYSIKCKTSEHSKRLIISNKLFHKDKSRSKLKVRQICNRLKKRCLNDICCEIKDKKSDSEINQRTKDKCGQVKACLEINKELRHCSSMNSEDTTKISNKLHAKNETCRNDSFTKLANASHNVVCKEEIQHKVDINEIIRIDRETGCNSDEEIMHFDEATKSSILYTLTGHAKTVNVNMIMNEGTSKSSESECFEDVGGYVEETVLSKEVTKAASPVVNDRSSIMENERDSDREYGEELDIRADMNEYMSKIVNERSNRNNGINDLEAVSSVKEVNLNKDITDLYSTIVGGSKRKYENELCTSVSDIIGVRTPKSEANTMVGGILNKLEVSDSDLSSDSTSDEESEGYEECTAAEVKAMLSSCN